MAYPIIFAQLAGGVQPLSDFDTMFNTVGNMATIFCTASGSNSIALTPIANMPTVAAYTNYQAFGFVATASSTGSVTINVSGVGALPAYASDGVTQLASGGVNSGIYYVFVYNSALNTGSGGFQILGSSGSGGFKTSVNVQTFTSGSGTYTPTTNTSIIVVEMVGGGGGGAGSANGTNNGGSGGTGGTTTFGTSLLVANGGVGGAGASAGAGGAGGTASLGTGPIGLTVQGGQGGGATQTPGASGYAMGGTGGNSFFGGSGGTQINAAGGSATTNSGSGGGGASTANNSSFWNGGAGGGAGGYVKALISSPAATYAYAVGAAGTAGAAGTGGYAGGAGGSGVIIVTEYINTPSALVSGFINSGTAGQIPYYAASGSTLTAENASAAGASMVLIATATASNSASISFTSIPSGYDRYVVIVTKALPVTASQFWMLWSENNGSTYLSASYSWTIFEFNAGGTGYTGNASTSQFILANNGGGVANTSGTGYSGDIFLDNLASSTQYKDYFVAGRYREGGTNFGINLAGGEYTGDTNAINAIKFQYQTGNISSGTFALYGIRNS